MRKFYGRKSELETLDMLLARDGAALGILYGRRRVGKTALITHWITAHPDVRTFLWFAEDGTPGDQLLKFSHALMAFLGRQPAMFSDWVGALQTLADAANQEDKLVIFIDEFTYLLRSNPAVSSQFQKAWDLFLQHKNVMLVLSGSYMGMMHEHVLSYQGALYGRTNAAIHLQPFRFGHTKAFFLDYPPAKRVELYAIWGGIAGYWNRLDNRVDLETNVITQLLTSNSAYHSEPRLLLYDHVQDPGRYVSILRAISHGNRVLKDIHAAVGLSPTSTTPYLSIMQDARLIERRIPVTASKKTKTGKYHVVDPFLRFYYRFIEPHMAEIEMGLREQALAMIDRHMVDFIGSHTWEEICREWVLKAGARSLLGFLPGTVGSLWNRYAQIDVAAMNSMDGKFILGECKWTNKPEGAGVIRKLVSQIDNVLPKKRDWEVTLLGFSRSGWTSAAEQEAKGLLGHKEKNWEIVGTQLLNLKEIDNNLSEWAEDV
jgi:AAA+ ATPase superfamily predicted ATPase